jgi:hypothetical protein
MRFGGEMGSFGGPSEPRRARLTGSILESIKAAYQIGDLNADRLKPDKEVRPLTERVLSN